LIPCQFQHRRLSQFEHGELDRVAQIHRAGHFRFCLHQPQEPFDQVIDIAERARLLAIAIDGDVVAPQRLHDEVRHHAAVLRVHARAIGVEDPRHLDLQPVLAVIVEEQRLGAPLSFIVARARPDRVDVAPVVFGLRMDCRITVHFAGRCLEDLALSRLASPSMLIAPCTDVLVVCTGSCW
jgi:hypothetical protein